MQGQKAAAVEPDRPARRPDRPDRPDRPEGGAKPEKKPRTTPEPQANVDEMEGLFVDAVPDSKKSRSARASDRRRERGQAPQPAGVPDTRTSLPGREAKEKRDKQQQPSQMSEMNGESRAYAKATLTCTRGPEEGLGLNLIEGTYTIGRARENSFVLKDIAASRRHLRIDVDSGGARVIDLGSGNGTRVNGKRIGEHELKHGDKIEIGGSVLLFQEKGRSAGDADRAVDDAQERVIRAAEKLAAELSERMRFGDESQSGFEDGHVAKTRALLPAQKKELDAEIARAKAAQAQAKPDKLWKETFTNLPLDKVLAADEPLRGGPRAAEQMPQPVMAPQVAVRQPLPRPMPLPMPMPPVPDEEIEVSSSTSSRGGGSFMVSLLVTALVVVVGGGAVLGAFLLTHRKGDTSEQVNEEASQQAFDDAMAKAEKAIDADEWTMAFEYATTAVNLHPQDKSAQRYQREARKHLDELKNKPVLVPAPAPAAPQVAAPAAPAASAAPTQQAVDVPAEKAPMPPPPTPAPPTVKKQQSARVQPKETTTKETTAPLPRKKSSSARMTDEAAQSRFEDAVEALRQKDAKKGCKILEEIADKAPPESRWKEKAENLYLRRCGET